ncbi:MAG: SMI1/KNR4 family protein [Verrucomicrobiota bacterium]
MTWLKNIFGDNKEGAKPEPVRNRPAAPADVARLESELGVKFPASLVRLYTETGGVNEPDARSWEVLRLMPLREVADINGRIAQRGMAALARRYSMVCFWADDQANYAGVFCGGFLDGRIFFLDHEGPYLGDFSPVFRSVESFQVSLDEAAERNRIIEYFEAGSITAEALESHASRFAWYRHCAPKDASTWDCLPVDYRSLPAEYSESDRAAYRECLKRVEGKTFDLGGERDFLVYSLARLVPPEELAVLFPFLGEDHMWIPARVAKILVLRECPEAIPHLVTLALSGNRNCRNGAQCALAKMIWQTPAAQGAIKALYSRQGGDFAEIQANLQTLQGSPSLFYQW